jgi:hypothetical protein
MTGTSPKSAISNAENGKAISGAWPNHVSACQNERLGSATRQTAADKANHSRKNAWQSALGALTMPKGDPNGECRLITFLEPLGKIEIWEE